MIIAIDIGGTKTLVVSFDKKGQSITEERFATPQDPHLFLKELESRLSQFDPKAVEAVSIAAPGSIDVEKGEIIYSPNLRWSNLALKAKLKATFTCPIFVENDANIAGLGATQALKTIPHLSLYVSIGTGIGTGIIINGQISPLFARSEGGHMVLETHTGTHTWEQFASGRAITNRFGKLASDITEQSDWEEIANALEAGFRVLIPILQPNIIIIGGGIGSHFEQFIDHLRKKLREEIPAFIPIPPFQQAIDPEKAVIHGCYYHALTILNTPHTA